MEEESACYLCGRAFGTESEWRDAGEEGTEEGEDVGGEEDVEEEEEEEAWGGSYPLGLLGQCEEGGQHGVKEAELRGIPPLRTTSLPLADCQPLPLGESLDQSLECSLPS